MLGQVPGTVIEACERSDNLRDGVAVLDEHLGVAPETSTETPNTYSVGCSTLTTGPDGAPTAPPAAVFPEGTMTLEGPGWVVSGAEVGGLVLP